MGLKNSKQDDISKWFDSFQYPVNNGTTIFQIYINLDHRTDRREQIEAELQRLNIGPFQRFSAIKNSHSPLGCSLSHIESLKQGIQSGADHIWIFEDDFKLTIEPELLQQIVKCVMETNYDVFLAGYCINNKFSKHTASLNHNIFKRIKDAQSAHSYLVNKKYASTLLKNFEQGATILNKTKNNPAVDQYWKLLQAKDMWITYIHGVCCIQRSGYSDIQNIMKENPTRVPIME